MQDNPYQPPSPLEAMLVEEPRSGASSAEIGLAAMTFRGLLFLYCVLVVATIVASIALESFLPEELRLYEEAQADMPLTAATFALAISALFSLLVHIVGWLGMLFFWRPSRWIFLTSEMLFFVVDVLFGPTVSHGVTDALGTGTSVIAGAILAMAFYSPVRERFVKRKPVL